MKKIILVLALILIASGLQSQPSNKILIASASDLKFALDSIVSVFKEKHESAQIDVVYGSSGKLFEQISNAAPFDLFFSADIEYPRKLKEKGIAISDVETYGIGRIVVWSKKVDPTSNGVNSLLDKSIVKIAIANPAHAPYGRRAEEALQYYKIYSEIKSKLVYGENISQTAQFVTTGAADAGIIALSLALSPPMKIENGQYYIVPENAHKPLEQGFVILKNAAQNSLAIQFKHFMVTKEAESILKYFGFSKKK